jgi:hypothetical protein
LYLDGVGGIDADGLGGILETDGGSFASERAGAFDVVIDDIGLADAGIPDEHDWIE